MPFKPGDKKPENAGRKPGTPNKKTTQLLEIWAEYDFCPAEEILKILNNESLRSQYLPKELTDLLEKLMQYKFPKRKAIEHTGQGGADLFSKLLDKVNERDNSGADGEA